MLKSLKSKKCWVFAVAMVMVFALSFSTVLGCSGQTTQTTQEPEAQEPASGSTGFETTELFIVGSDTCLEVSQLLVEEFLELHPDQNLNLPVSGGGSGTGIAGLIDGTTDLANSSRPIKEEEIQAGKDNGLNIDEVTIPFDGISVIVHNDNPVEAMTLEQISDVFSGKVTNWSQVGGADADILITSRDSSSGTHVFFREEVVQLGGAEMERDFSEQSLFLASNAAIREEVSDNVNAIGYIGLGYLDESVKAVGVQTDDGADPVGPSIENIVAGMYPVARGLYVYTPQPVDQLSDLAQAFFAFVLSDAGQAIVEEVGFVPVK